MKNSIAISYINIFLFVVYILQQYFLYTAVNYRTYLVKKNKRNAIPESICINFSDAFVIYKIEIL
jgi:hypothetical protein